MNIYKASKITDLNDKNSYEYRDYLKICKKLNYNLKDDFIKYPKDITKAHDDVLKLYEIKKNKIMDNQIKKRYKKLSQNIFKNKKYIIYPVKLMSELIEESNQQHNCVKTYAENIADELCDIYFMRLISNQEKSLVTVEVRGNKVVQKRTKFNKPTTKDQDKFLDLWEKKILKGNM